MTIWIGSRSHDNGVSWVAYEAVAVDEATAASSLLIGAMMFFVAGLSSVVAAIQWSTYNGVVLLCGQTDSQRNAGKEELNWLLDSVNDDSATTFANIPLSSPV